MLLFSCYSFVAIISKKNIENLKLKRGAKMSKTETIWYIDYGCLALIALAIVGCVLTPILIDTYKEEFRIVEEGCGPIILLALGLFLGMASLGIFNLNSKSGFPLTMAWLTGCVSLALVTAVVGIYFRWPGFKPAGHENVSFLLSVNPLLWIGILGSLAPIRDDHHFLTQGSSRSRGLTTNKSFTSCPLKIKNLFSCSKTTE